ncbi:MAG: DUF4412 domain-containing protein [Bacteroidetes bacterium]|nr:DUF4412 domain-containing protein [Bacteroidota bacterium]
MRSKVIMLLIALMFMGFQSEAKNWGNKLKNKVVNKLENKADQKADQAIDNAVDQSEQKIKESVKSNEKEKSGQQPPPDERVTEQDMLQFLEMMGGSTVSIDDYPDLDAVQPSDFKGSFDMSFENSSDGKVKDQGTVSWHIREYDVAMIPMVEDPNAPQNARIVIDRKKGVIVILTDNNGEKTGMITKMKETSVDLSDVEEAKDLDNLIVKVFKHEIRMVNGYKCYKVLAYNDEMESVSWVTEQITLDMAQLMSFMNIQSQDKSTYEEKFGHIKGMMIESTSTEKKTGEVNKVSMQNFKIGYPQTDVFSTEGYNLLSLPDFGQ